MSEQKKILAIDPGTEQSAYVVYDGTRPVESGTIPNDDIRDLLRGDDECEHLAIEGIACQGMAVGAETFTTCIWIGRFIEVWCGEWSLVYRNEVKMHLCGSPRAKDPNIRQALIDKFGGESVAIGGVKCAGCKGKGTSGFQYDKCDVCFGDGRVEGKVSQWKQCPACKGACIRRGAKALCESCRGSTWKFRPGPLYGIATHAWAALAVAVTFTEKRELTKTA